MSELPINNVLNVNKQPKTGRSHASHLSY